MTTNNALTQTIDLLELTVRTKNHLLANNIVLIKDLVQCTERSLSQFLGRKSLNEVKEALSLRDLTLAPIRVSRKPSLTNNGENKTIRLDGSFTRAQLEHLVGYMKTQE